MLRSHRAGARFGAYEVVSHGKDLILIATGSEVGLITKAAEEFEMV